VKRMIRAVVRAALVRPVFAIRMIIAVPRRGTRCVLPCASVIAVEANARVFRAARIDNAAMTVAAAHAGPVPTMGYATGMEHVAHRPARARNAVTTVVAAHAENAARGNTAMTPASARRAHATARSVAGTVAVIHAATVPKEKDATSMASV
jgi:hypothetical protein